MRHTNRLRSVLVLALLAAPVRAQEAPPKQLHEYWDAAYVEGIKTGHFHTVVHETQKDGEKRITTTQEMSLKVKRDRNIVELKMENSVEERPDGTVVGVSVTMFTPNRTTVTGRVEGDKLVVRDGDGRELKKLPWDAKAVGLYKQDRFWKEKKLKAGDRFDFTNFELAIERAFRINVAVKGMEEAVALEVKKGDPKAKAEYVKRELLRAEGVPDKVEISGAPLQLPRVVTWLDKEGNVVSSETQMPGLGRIVSYRTTKEVALEPGAAPARLPDILETTLIPLNKPIDRPGERTEVVFRITMTGDDEPKSTFAHDFRQSFENEKGKVIDLRVRAQRSHAVIEKPQDVSLEDRIANQYLDSSDEVVKKHTARAIGTEKDAWTKAQKIEKWVHQNMTGTSSVVFATASQVARDLKGDCRQHAMLTAAMCRAANLPARTALGLVYTIDREKGPVLAFHMWAEVYIVDQWMTLDATLGQGGVGPTHLKVSDHNWHNTQTIAPLLTVLRVLDKIKVEVVAVK